MKKIAFLLMLMAAMPCVLTAQDLIDEYEVEWVYKYSSYDLETANPDSVFGFYEYGEYYSPEDFTDESPQLTSELLKCKNLQYLELHNVMASEVLEHLDEFPLLQVLILDNVGIPGLPDGIYTLEYLKKLELYYFSEARFDEEGLAGNSIRNLVLDNVTMVCGEGESCEIPLELFPNLTTLKLRGELGHLPPGLFECTELVELNVSECELEEIDPEIASLEALETVILSYNYYLSDLPEEFGYLSNLSTLDISGTGFTKLPYCLENCSNLGSIDASNSSLEEIPDFIGSLSQLYELRMNGCSGLSSLPAELADCEGLSYLALYGCGFTEVPSAIGKMKALIDLDLSFNQIMTIPASLGGASALERLDLSGNPIKTFEGGSLNLQALYRLNLAGCGLRKVDPEIFRLSNLQSLDLSNDSITEIPAGLYKMKTLSFVNLSDNQIRKLPKGIGAMTSLYELDMSLNQLTALPKDIVNLSAMNYLTLADNKLKKLPKNMHKMGALGTLDIRGNKGISLKTKELQKITSMYSFKIRPGDVSDSELEKIRNSLGEGVLWVSEY